MPGMAAVANPGSYLQAFLTFRATGRAARGAACGTTGLVGLDIARSVPASFIPELRSKLRPRCIDCRFSLRSIREILGDNIPDHDQTVLAHQLRGLDMQVMPTCICDFGVDTLNPFLIAGALRLRQGALVFLKVPRIFNLAAIGQRGKCAQAEIDANFAGSAGLALSNLNLQAEIPAPARVLRKASGLDLAIDWAATPEPITAAEIDHGVAVEFDGARGRKRDPAEAFLPPPVRAAARSVSIDNKLTADGLHGIAVQTEEQTAPSRELDKIEGTRPTFFLASRCLLRFAAEVPNAIHRQRMGTEALGAGRILNAVSIGEHHTVYLIGRLSLARRPRGQRKVSS